MKQIHIKNKLYILPALLFCLGLQSTAQTNSTESNVAESNMVRANTELSLDLYNHVNEQATDVSDTSINRRHNRPKQRPRPNSTESYNMTESQNINAQYYTNHNYTNHTMQQNSAGSLDVSFGGIGLVSYSIGGTNPIPRAIATQPNNNKIVVAGIRDNRAVLVRYNENGALDTDFGSGGVVSPNIGGTSFFNAVAIQQQCGVQKIIGAGGSAGKCVITRYNENSSIDTLFGDQGIVRTDIVGEINAVAIQEDNNIVVAGYNTLNASNTQIVLMRFDGVNGTPDNNFGIRGVVFTPIGNVSIAHGVTIQKHDNKIVVVGTVKTGNRDDMVVARYNEDGTPDDSFGTNGNGVITLRVGRRNSIAYDVTIQKDRKIIVVGRSNSPSHDRSVFTTIRLNENGSFDNSFNGNGIAIISPLGNNDLHAYARSVALDENENIIVMGYQLQHTTFSGPPYLNYFCLVRYDQNGTLDANFGHGGKVASLFRNNDYNKGTTPVVGAIQNDGKKLILVGNYSFYRAYEDETTYRFGVARYWN